MSWFLNLKTAQKIVGLLIIAVVFMGIVGLVGCFNLKKASDIMESMYNDRLLPIMWLNENRTHIRANEANILWLILTRDKSKQEKYLTDIKTRAGKFNENIAAYEKTKLDPYEVENLAKLKESLSEYRAVRAKTLDMVKQGKSQEAYNYFVHNIESFNNTTKYLINLTDYNQKVAAKINEQNKVDTNYALIIVLITLILAVSILTAFCIWLSTMFARRFRNLEGIAERVASGDLTTNVKIEAKDEIGLTAIAINNIAVNLRKLVQEIHGSVEQVAAGSEEMSASADQTAQGAQQVAISVQQLAGGSQEQAHSVNRSLENVNDISRAIQKISENADNTVELSKSTENNAAGGYNQAEKAVGKINQIKVSATEVSNTINELGKLSSDIEQIVDLIKGIASQTNLLALNAAIEAARAGEHGKGFAVVAEEVKKLAGQSATATDKITGMIKEIQNKTNTAVITMNEAVEEVTDGVVIVESTGKALEEILKDAKVTSSQVSEISKEVNNLAKNSDNVVKMMENISSVTEESSASSEEIASIVEEQTATLQEINASSQTLAKIAENLQNQISVFKI
jgi:methyl-accepting chemotaxis protein